MSSSEIPQLNNSNINNNKEKSILKKNSTTIEIENQNLNNSNIISNNIINKLNETDSNNNKLMSSKEWINYFKQSNINLEEINTALLSNVESIDNENMKLKEALNELIKDLKEKEDSLDESLKLISKLKINYSNLFNQYKNLENKYIKLSEENEVLKIEQNNIISKKISNNEINNKNLKDEMVKMKKDEIALKNDLMIKKNENMKLMKEYGETKAMFEDMKKKNLEYLGMVKDREDLIMEYNNQIKKLDNEINDKNEQIKLLVKFSKNINDENKTNVKELTKQACKTIKLFYNYNNQNNVNNNDIISNNNDSLNKIIKLIFNDEDLEDIKINNNNLNKNMKITLKLKEALVGNISFDDLGGAVTSIKEYLINIFIKLNLIKLELFSSYIREFHFVSFLSNLIKKISFDNIDNLNLLNLRNKIIEIKTKNEKLYNENNEIKVKLFEYKNKINELNLFIKKIKDDFSTKKNKIKENVKKIIDNYENKIDELNNKIEQYKLKKYKNSNNYKNINNNINDIDIKNNVSFNQKNITKQLKIDNEISFNIIHLKKDVKPKKYNQRKNFNFSLNNQSLESNKIPNNFAYKTSVNSYNNSEMNEKNYLQKNIEINKLKEEISYLKSEIAELIQDINRQQKLISESNCQTKNSHVCEKCEFIYNLILKSNLSDIKKLSEIKNILNNLSNNKNIINDLIEIINIITKIISISDVDKNFNSIDNNYQTIMVNNNINNKKKSHTFFNELNAKLFSTSELKKYYSIYSKNVKNISELIKIFEKRSDDIKNNFINMKLTFDSTISEQFNNEKDISFNNNKKIKLIQGEDKFGYFYKNMQDEIIRLKQDKIIFDNSIELIKNYLIIYEKIFEFFVERKKNIEQFRQYSSKIFNKFKESFCYNIDEISDNNIFHKKLILKLFEENLLKI